MLYVLIVLFAPISGAHFNPVVSLSFAWRKAITWRKAAWYVPVQVIGAVAGVILAHAMFGLPLLEIGVKVRAGWPQYMSEGIATAGLLATIFLGHRARPAELPALVGAYIAAAYWFTASTAFANPAVTIARAFTTTFAGIRPIDVPAFLIAQIVGAVLGLILVAGFTGRRADLVQKSEAGSIVGPPQIPPMPPAATTNVPPVDSPR
jgi:glycerol uptake facilitator-like aquaporin